MAKPVDPEEARTLLRMVAAEQEQKLRERMMADRPPVSVAVLWLGRSDVDIETYFGTAPGSPGPKAQERDGAEAFLREALAEGPVSSQDLLRQGLELGLSDSTLRRAKKRLRVVATRRNANGAWYWRWPTLEEAASLDGQVTISTV